MRSRNDRPLVISTRDESASGPFARLLSDAGVQLRSLPTTRMIAGPDVDQFGQWLSELEAFDWIAFTSRHAVDVVWSMPEMTAAWRLASNRPRVAAVGPATAAALEQVGVAVDVVPARASGQALAEDIGSLGRRESHQAMTPDVLRVLWPCAAGAHPAFGDVLTRAGVVVSQAAVYTVRSIAPSDARELHAWLHSDALAAVCFFSPSAASGLAAALGRRDLRGLPPAAVASLGPSTSLRLRDLGAPPDVESPLADASAFAAAVVAVLGADGGLKSRALHAPAGGPA